MAARLALFALSLCLAAPARAEMEPKLLEALVYVRDATDGGALWAYLRRDPIPVAFARLPIGVDSRYVRMQGRAWIELSDRLREEPGEALGRAVYHQYIHRLQDRSPEVVTAAQADTSEGYAMAMRYLRQQIRPGGPLPDAPPEVRRDFGAPTFERHAHASEGRGVTTIVVYRH